MEERAAKDALQAELHTMLLQLHSTQLQMHEVKGLEVDSNDIKRKLVSAACCCRHYFLFLYIYIFYFFLFFIFLPVVIIGRLGILKCLTWKNLSAFLVALRVVT